MRSLVLALLLVAAPLTGVAALPVNELPVVGLDVADTWFAVADLVGILTRAEACDADGSIQAMWTQRLLGGGGGWSGFADAPCAENSVAFGGCPECPAEPPRTHVVRASAADDACGTGTTERAVRVEVLPFEPAGVPGFPDLGALGAPGAAASVLVEAVLTRPEVFDDEKPTVVAWRVSYDGVLQGASGAIAAGPDETLVLVALDLGAGTATVAYGGATRWSGGVLQEGAEWWQVVPPEDVHVRTGAGLVAFVPSPPVGPAC